MTALDLLAGAIITLLVTGWWLSWVATRLDRAHARVERSWAALDAALVRRAQRCVEAVAQPGVDPATSLLVCDAAAGSLEPDLSVDDRELAESTLSHLLGLTGLPGVELQQDRVALARRLHNDAVVTVQRLRRRRLVRLFRLAGHAADPRPFEMADDRQLT